MIACSTSVIDCSTSKTRGFLCTSGFTKFTMNSMKQWVLLLSMLIQLSLRYQITGRSFQVFSCLEAKLTFQSLLYGHCLDWLKLLMTTQATSSHGVYLDCFHLVVMLPTMTSTTPKTLATTEVSQPSGTLFLTQTKNFMRLIQKTQESTRNKND